MEREREAEPEREGEAKMEGNGETEGVCVQFANAEAAEDCCTPYNLFFAFCIAF